MSAPLTYVPSCLRQTFARGVEHAKVLERARVVYGDGHVDRAVRCYQWFDVTTEHAVALAGPLAVIEWMASR